MERKMWGKYRKRKPKKNYNVKEVVGIQAVDWD